MRGVHRAPQTLAQATAFAADCSGVHRARVTTNDRPDTIWTEVRN